MLDRNKHPNHVICPKCGQWGTKAARFIKCGNPKCNKCAHGPSHGPYWYVYHRVGNKVKNCYIGRTWPTLEKEKKKSENKASMVAVWVPKGELEKLDELVKMKLYPNRDEAFRFAVHDLLKRELNMLPQAEEGGKIEEKPKAA